MESFLSVSHRNNGVFTLAVKVEGTSHIFLFHFFKSLRTTPTVRVAMDTSRKKNAGKKNAGKGKAGIPRKVPRKESTALASANTAGVAANVGEGQFGGYAVHRDMGKVRPKSPPGANMSLSRRLSRKIIQGSPLRSPM